jgi:hypothetical protein
MQKYLFPFLLFSTFLVHAQVKNPKPHFETFLKTSYGYIDNDKPVHLLNAEASLYINTFGNTARCEEGDNIAGCFLFNVITFISALEISGGFDTTYFDDKFYLSPKAAFYLRPLYYGKAGFTISTLSLNSSVGISFPIKKDYLVEMLFQSNMVNFKNAPFDENLSRFQIGLQIPFYTDLSIVKKSKNVIF